MDEDSRRVAKQAQQEREDYKDYCDEIAGRPNGKIGRYVSKCLTEAQKQKERRERTALELALLDVQYREAYNNAMDALAEAEAVVQRALLSSAQELNTATLHHDALLSRASTLGERRVFMDDDGKAYDELGNQLSEDEIQQVDWRENSPAWKVYDQSLERVSKAQIAFDRYSNTQERVDRIRNRLESHDDPLSQQKLNSFETELRAIVDENQSNQNIAPDSTITVPTNIAGLSL